MSERRMGQGYYPNQCMVIGSHPRRQPALPIQIQFKNEPPDLGPLSDERGCPYEVGPTLLFSFPWEFKTKELSFYIGTPSLSCES